jgi:hypothetical protein
MPRDEECLPLNNIGARVVETPGAFAEHGSVAALKRNRQCADEKLLNHERRGTSKLSIANTGGNTTYKLPEVLAKRASCF